MRDWKRVGKSLSQDTLQPVVITETTLVCFLMDDAFVCGVGWQAPR